MEINKNKSRISELESLQSRYEKKIKEYDSLGLDSSYAKNVKKCIDNRIKKLT
ncbi:hypothetical protein Phi46:3_gp071 [Cellulophaga phage phi46:3]|uniref:Uncharacterized protein n=2 Tax=Pachyviridae TaxID=2946166 RepID=R9ZZ23_9CAUD|nr:hypothetical protein Phi46:3_gp071 [Cellulophaga phage phi46:3]YP_008241270.1 hypothetical protein Phi18:3_gp077 [Cellulophaga phage phi18:3]AGO48589.1 hypothetical protein Phi18:3_gp077 [Cellulophaga phage phi18:3]AGO48815.1 hypothetical protein Phi46:3_gp071 [Cellulophaga phage phi46:3]